MKHKIEITNTSQYNDGENYTTDFDATKDGVTKSCGLTVPHQYASGSMLFIKAFSEFMDSSMPE